jgi:hypothetical protein
MNSLLLLPDAIAKTVLVLVVIVAYIRRNQIKAWWRE